MNFTYNKGTYGYIYAIQNTINGKFYIGVTTRNPKKRWNEHINNTKKNSAIDNAIQKYNAHNFTFSVIDTADNQKELNTLEESYICLFSSKTTVNGYNIKNGGSNGKHSKESRLKMSEAKKGKSKSEEHKLKLKKLFSDSNSGGMFNFYGSTYIGETPTRKNGLKPWWRVWRCRIGYNMNRQDLGVFEDPLSSQIVYDLVKEEIYGEVLE